MKNKVYHFLPIIALVIVLLSGCSLSSTLKPTEAPAQASPTPEPVDEPTETPTSNPPTAAITSVPPTETFTPVPPSATPTASSTPTEVPTDIPTSTPTEEPAFLVVDRDAVCRSGPGTDYPIVGYQSAGDNPDVIAQSDTDPVWWVIEYEGKDAPCWIADDIVSVTGALDSLTVLAPPPTPTAKPPSTAGGENIYYYLVKENTGGPFGCGDSLLYIDTGIPYTGDTTVDIQTALNAMFSNHNEYYNGLYNPMYRSSLRAADVDIVEHEPEMQVWLVGDFAKPKDKCDAFRMRAQVWETVESQNPENQHAVIFVHGALLGDLLVTGW